MKRKQQPFTAAPFQAVQLFFSDGHDTGIYSWDLLYDLGVNQETMWAKYLKRLADAGAKRAPG